MSWLDPDLWKGPAALLGYWQAIAAALVVIGGAIAAAVGKGSAPLKWVWSHIRRSSSAPVAAITTKRYLKKADIVSGSAQFGRAPEYQAIPAQRGAGAHIFLDYSNFVGGMGNYFWSKRRRILLAERGAFSPDWAIKVPIMSKYDIDGGRTLWRWGSEAKAPTDNDYLFIPNTWYRGKIVFVGPDGVEEPCRFIVLPVEGVKLDMPLLIGERIFHFNDELEGSDEPLE